MCWLFALQTQTVCDIMFLFHPALWGTSVGGRTWQILATNICFYIHQMSKSTGNFLTLTQAIDKFSADGTFTFSWFITLLCSVPFLLLFSHVMIFVQNLRHVSMKLCRKKTTPGVHLRLITMSTYSSRIITLDYTRSIFYPMVKIIGKHPIFIR